MTIQRLAPTTQAPTQAPARPVADPPLAGVRTSSLPAWLPALALLALIRAASPGGYIGGGGDDWYYLEAARCIAGHGWCLPDTHWASRFPLVAPMGALLALVGEGARSLAIVPLAYAVAAILLLAANVERRFGRTPAMLAAIVLVLTPAFAGPALQPNADIPELAWILATCLAIQIAIERDDGRAAAIAGLLMAIAVLTRVSAIAILPLLALGWATLLPARRRWLVVPFAAALGGCWAIEAAAYGVATGHPAFGWALSLHHATIPSTELAPGVDTHRGALFNLDFIRGWRRNMGIEVHWTVDPLLNLLADPASGLTLIGAAALAIARRGAARPIGGQVGRLLAILGIAAALRFLILVFVLAIDPKPRMFLPEVAVAATMIGMLAAHGWRHGQRAILIALVALIAGCASIVAYDAVNLGAETRVAGRWLTTTPPGTAVDEWTRRSLALVPGLDGLPRETGHAPVLVLTLNRCTDAAQARGAGWTIDRAARFVRHDPAPIAWLRARRVLFRPRPVPSLCLLSPPADRAASPRG